MRFYLYGNVQISVGTAFKTRIALSAHGKSVVIVDTCGNFDVYRAFLANFASAAADLAGIFYYLTRSVAV